MLKIKARYFQSHDERGTIEGLINIGTWREINKISSVAGSIRGKHYHKKTQELFIILDGRIKVFLEKIENNIVISTDCVEVRAGDVFIIAPYIQHTFTVIADAVWLNALSEPFDQRNPDFFRGSHEA